MWASAPEVSRFAARDRKQPKPQHSPIPLKVAVSCENVPLAAAPPHKSGNQSPSPLVPEPGTDYACEQLPHSQQCQLPAHQKPQIIPQLDKLFLLAKAREQLLSDRSHHLHPALPNQLRKGLRSARVRAHPGQAPWPRSANHHTGVSTKTFMRLWSFRTRVGCAVKNLGAGWLRDMRFVQIGLSRCP